MPENDLGGITISSHDSRGLPLSTDSVAAAGHYRTGVDFLLAAWSGVAEALDQAIHEDPGFALAHAARARQHIIRAEMAQARARIAVASELVAEHGDARERSHVHVLSLSINGQPAKALEQALVHVDAWPRDALILSLPLGAFGLFAFSGMADHDQAQVTLCERHARHYAADDWWFLTSYGWAQTESGAVAPGRDMTQLGFGLRRDNANAVHALSHAMFECGAGDDADRLIAGWLPGYARSAPLHGHIAWHAALVALEHGDADHALKLYLDNVQPPVSRGMPLNVLSDTASFLWRMQAYGHALPEGSWTTAAAYAQQAFPRAGFPFVDVHMALVEAATGNTAALEQRVSALVSKVEAGTLAAGPVVPAICRAVLAFTEEDYAGCVQILEPVAGDVVRIGGSGAQREVIEDTLLLALMRSGETEKARTLLDERLHRRPSPRDARWLRQLPG